MLRSLYFVHLLCATGTAWVLPGLRSSNALRLRQKILVKSSNGGGGAGGLRAEDFTGMAWDAIQKMPTIAEEARQQSVDTEMLLKALLENVGKVLTRESLEGRLYSWGEEVSSNALEVHIHHLRKKLPQDFIKTVRGIGYTVPRQ